MGWRWPWARRPEPPRGAAIYARGGTVYVVRLDRTATGTWIEAGPVAACPLDDVPALAAAVLGALRASRDGVAPPARHGVAASPLPGAAGVASYAAFVGSARSVTAELAEDRVTLTPLRNEGARRGFRPLVEAVETAAPEAGALGAALARALARAA